MCELLNFQSQSECDNLSVITRFAITFVKNTFKHHPGPSLVISGSNQLKQSIKSAWYSMHATMCIVFNYPWVQYRPFIMALVKPVPCTYLNLLNNAASMVTLTGYQSLYKSYHLPPMGYKGQPWRLPQCTTLWYHRSTPEVPQWGYTTCTSNENHPVSITNQRPP